MFNWFGRKSAPARVGVPWLTGSESGFARGYEAQLDEVYRRNPVGLRAVRLVAEAVGGLTVDGDERGLVTGALLERAAAGLLLHGNAYVQLIADGHDRPAELHALRPERVSVVAGADGWPAAYVYRAGASATRIERRDALGRRQVAHVRGLHPGDDHYDPERDFQTGQMRASSGSGGTRGERVELPAVMTGERAKALVEEALARKWRSGDRLRLNLGPSRISTRPGQALQLAGQAALWVIKSVIIEGLKVAVEAEPAPAMLEGLPADPGRATTSPDQLIGRTELALFEAPASGDQASGYPIIQVAGSSADGWKSVPLEWKLGTEALPGSAILRRAMLGYATTVLPDRAPMILDGLSTVIVRMADDAAALFNCDDDGLMAGANLAMLGNELIQFGRAEELEPGTYRLSRLLRGRRGTEWAAAGHEAGEPFCLVDQAVRPIELPPTAAGSILTAIAHGIGDAAPLPQAERSVSGEAMRPPPPCHLTASVSGVSLRAQWVRRSHRGWAWLDEVGVPDDGFAEAYRVTVEGPSGSLVIETQQPALFLSSTELPAAAGETIRLSVVTVGPKAVSRDISTTVIL